MQLLAYLLARFSEASSYAGLAAVLALLGLHLSDSAVGQLAEFLAAGCGLAAVLLKERGLLPALVVAAALFGFGLSACSTTAQRDINAVLGSSVAAEAVRYVAALDPALSGYLADADAAIARDAPQVLKVACGAVSMGNLIVGTVHTIDPRLVSDALYREIEASVAAIEAPCSNPPQNLAGAARAALAAWSGVFQAIKDAGVAVTPAAG
jgi:hypothetical protein